MNRLPRSPAATWLFVGLAGLIPALTLLWLAQPPDRLALVAGPLLAIGLMGTAMIGVPAAGRLWAGLLLALASGAALIALALALGASALPHPFSTALALIVASTSFAARGALFARAYAGRGWLLALFVVGGEAAMLVTAAWLPPWLLTLLPAQWASTAIQTAITGTGTRAAAAPLIALAGTAATTLLVVRLLPRRWPYILMFSGWLALSALVSHHPAAPVPHADLVAALAGGR